MKPYTLSLNPHTSILSALALVIGLVAMPAHAHMAVTPDRASNPSLVVHMLDGQAPTPSPALSPLTKADFDQFTAKEWKQLRRELIHTLRTAGDTAWEQAAQDVLYLSLYYRDRVDFERASTPLLEAYLLDQNEKHRILALAALYAIGDHDTMAHLGQRVRLEASPRVRRLTTAAVTDYFTPEAPVKIGLSRQIGSTL